MAYTGPAKEAFLTQIDADLEGETEDKAVLKERRSRVSAAKTDEAASKAYHGHLEEIRAAALEPDDE